MSMSATQLREEAFQTLSKRIADIASWKKDEKMAFVLSVLATLYGADAFDARGRSLNREAGVYLAGSERNNAKTVKEFDMIIDVESMLGLSTSGWPILRGSGCGGSAARAPCLFKGLLVSVVGHFSKGKTWLLHLLFGVAPEETNQLIATRGLSILQWQEADDFFTLIDTAGRGPPIIETGIGAFADRLQLEDMMSDVVMTISDTFIYVVGDLTWGEQREIFQLIARMQRRGVKKPELFVVHNLRNWKVDTYQRYVFMQFRQRYPLLRTGTFGDNYFFMEGVVDPPDDCTSERGGDCASVVVRHYFAVNQDDTHVNRKRCIKPSCVKARSGVDVPSSQNADCVKVACNDTVDTTSSIFNSALADELRMRILKITTLSQQAQATDVLALALARINAALQRLTGDFEGDIERAAQAGAVATCDSSSADAGVCGGVATAPPTDGAMEAALALCKLQDEREFCDETIELHWLGRMLAVNNTPANDAESAQRLVKTYNWTVVGVGEAIVAPLDGGYDPREVVFVPKTEKYAPRIVQFIVPRYINASSFYVEHLGGSSRLFQVTGRVAEPRVLGLVQRCHTEACETYDRVEDWTRYETQAGRHGAFKRRFFVPVEAPNVENFSCVVMNGVLEIAIFPQKSKSAKRGVQPWMYHAPAGATERRNCIDDKET